MRAEENREILRGMMVELVGGTDFERDRRLYDTRRPLTVASCSHVSFRSLRGTPCCLILELTSSATYSLNRWVPYLQRRRYMILVSEMIDDVLLVGRSRKDIHQGILTLRFEHDAQADRDSSGRVARTFPVARDSIFIFLRMIRSACGLNKVGRVSRGRGALRG